MSQIPPNPIIVNLCANISGLEAAITEFDLLRSFAPEDVFKNLVRLSEVVDQLISLRSENRIASGASETVVFLEPSDGFLRVLAALRAGDFDLLTGNGLLNIIRHDSVSVGSVGTSSEERASGESQGSSDGRDHNSQSRKYTADEIVPVFSVDPSTVTNFET